MRLILIAFVFACSLSAQNNAPLYLHDSNLDMFYTVDPLTGAATLVGPTIVGGVGPGTPAGLAFDGTTLYTLDLGGGTLWTVDPLTALCTMIGTSGISGWQDITWDPVTAQFYAVNQNDMLYSIDLTGNATLVGPTPAAMLLTAMAVDSAGQLWAMNFLSPGELGTLDRMNGAFTVVFNTNLANVQGMDFQPGSGMLYASDTATDTLHRIDITTGVFTTVGPHGAGVAFAKSLRFGGVSNQASVTSVGTGCLGSNGVVTLASQGGLLPQIGSNGFTLELTNGASNSFAAFYLAANAQAGALPVAPGCFIHLDLPSLIAFINSGANPLAVVPTGTTGTALLSAPVPNDPMIVGALLGVQAAVTDPAAPGGFTLSNALDVMVGL